MCRILSFSASRTTRSFGAGGCHAICGWCRAVTTTSILYSATNAGVAVKRTSQGQLPPNTLAQYWVPPAQRNHIFQTTVSRRGCFLTRLTPGSFRAASPTAVFSTTSSTRRFCRRLEPAAVPGASAGGAIVTATLSKLQLIRTSFACLSSTCSRRKVAASERCKTTCSRWEPADSRWNHIPAGGANASAVPSAVAIARLLGAVLVGRSLVCRRTAGLRVARSLRNLRARQEGLAPEHALLPSLASAATSELSVLGVRHASVEPCCRGRVIAPSPPAPPGAVM